MSTDAEIRIEGFRALSGALGDVNAERFIPPYPSRAFRLHPMAGQTVAGAECRGHQHSRDALPNDRRSQGSRGWRQVRNAKTLTPTVSMLDPRLRCSCMACPKPSRSPNQ